MNPADDHRDRELDAAWRAASGEEPPVALDAAIAAAARRAVDAGPRRAHASRVWWPVAAAAAVAVVAIGIVEMTPPEEVAPTTMAPAPPAQAERRDESPTPAEPRTKETERQAPPRAQGAAQVGGATPDRGAAPPGEPVRKLERESPAASAAATSAAPQRARAAAKPGNPFPAVPSDASPAANAAAAQPTDRLAAKPAAEAHMQTSTPPAATAAAPAPEEARQPASPRAAGALAARSEAAPSNAPAALARRAPDGEAKSGEPEPRTVNDWISLIRRLRAEGRSDLAAKELTAFRALYKERADALLPIDLRGAKP